MDYFLGSCFECGSTRKDVVVNAFVQAIHVIGATVVASIDLEARFVEFVYVYVVVWCA